MGFEAVREVFFTKAEEESRTRNLQINVDSHNLFSSRNIIFIFKMK